MRRISADIAAISMLATEAWARICAAAAAGMMPSSACASASAASNSSHCWMRFSSEKMARNSSVLHRCWSDCMSKTETGMVRILEA